MRHAYYLATLDQTFGDAEYGIGLRELYMSFCGRQIPCSKYDGVSRYDTPAGVKTILLVKNFFDPNPAAFATLEIP